LVVSIGHASRISETDAAESNKELRYI